MVTRNFKIRLFDWSGIFRVKNQNNFQRPVVYLITGALLWKSLNYKKGSHERRKFKKCCFKLLYAISITKMTSLMAPKTNNSKHTYGNYDNFHKYKKKRNMGDQYCYFNYYYYYFNYVLAYILVPLSPKYSCLFGTFGI